MIITAVNAGPRKTWNTAQLVHEAARGAQEAGAQIRYFDLYDREKFTGCISCFGCKRNPNEGICICRDGLSEILASIRGSDAVIFGSPNYLGQPTAGFRALYERLVFQNLTYQVERRWYREAKTPSLFIMTSKMPAEGYAAGPSRDMIEYYREGLTSALGPCDIFLCGDTKQVPDYSRYNWTMFDAAHKIARHEEVFECEKRRAYEAGAMMAKGKGE